MTNELKEGDFKFNNFSQINEDEIPNTAGIYVFKVLNIEALPQAFSDILSSRNNRFFYIGQASKSLHERMYNQELMGKKHGTFFRSTGAVLGFLPPMGSLANQETRNFKFSKEDSSKIVQWMKENLEIGFLSMDENLDQIESNLIMKYEPLLNIKGNPNAVPELSVLRKKCLDFARQENIDNEDVTNSDNNLKFDISSISELFNDKEKLRISFAVDEVQFENAGYDADYARIFFDISKDGELIDWDKESLDGKVIPSTWHELKDICDGYICYPFVNDDGWDDEEHICDMYEIDDSESVYNLCNALLNHVKAL